LIACIGIFAMADRQENNTAQGYFEGQKIKSLSLKKPGLR